MNLTAGPLASGAKCLQPSKHLSLDWPAERRVSTLPDVGDVIQADGKIVELSGGVQAKGTSSGRSGAVEIVRGALRGHDAEQDEAGRQD
jgi:hypothetical protein